MASSLTLYDLPDELLTLIAELCYDTKTYYGSLCDFHIKSCPFVCFAARTPIYHLSLTTKRLRQIAIPILFRRVLVHTMLYIPNRDRPALNISKFPATDKRLGLVRFVDFSKII
jgi:hypothetical protein